MSVGSFMGGILGGLVCANPSASSALGQANAAQGATSASQLGQQLQAQQSGLSNQLGQMVTYNGQAPQILTSPHVPSGSAYMLPNGTTIANPTDLTGPQLEELKSQWLASKKEQFLKHPDHYREAFLNDLRAKAVREDMNETGMFGVNRPGRVQGNGYALWAHQNSVTTEITLTQYEEWHSSDVADKILLGNNDE